MDSAQDPISVASIIPEMGSDPVAAVRAGLPYAALEHVRERLSVSDELFARVLGISTRTLTRRRKQGQLTTDESDRLVLLAEVAVLAIQAFDSTEAARRWLQTPHALLDGESPFDHMDTVAGIEEVKTMLYHIEYSLPA